MTLTILRPALAVAAVLAIGGCSGYNDRYGDGYGRVGYGDYYGSRYGSYYGWYGDYYSPGTGYYVSDHRGPRHRWNDGQRRYWEARRDRHRDREWRENWSGYHGRDWREDRRDRRPRRPR